MEQNIEAQAKFKSNLFLVGGTGRNVGKSTFVEMVINQFYHDHEIVALKISNIKPGDEAVHGWHGHPLTAPFLIEEEKNADCKKDSKRFLAAGAHRSFFMRAFEESLPQAMQAFFQQISPKVLIVVESNTLRSLFDPGVFVMVTNEKGLEQKPAAAPLLEQADLVLSHFDKTYFKQVIDQIAIVDEGWRIIG